MRKVLAEQLATLRRESEERAAKQRAEHCGVPYIDATHAAPEIEALRLLSRKDAERAQVAPVRLTGTKLILAVFDCVSRDTQAIIQQLTAEHFNVSMEICSLSTLRYFWTFYERVQETAVQITGEIIINEVNLATFSAQGGLSKLGERLVALDPKMIKTADVFDTILLGAVSSKASDIHFEPEEQGVRIRYRIDGLLHDVTSNFSAELYHQIISRIKLLSKLKFNVITEPQDGRFTIDLPGDNNTEVRVSILPSEFGETIVLRILYTAAIALELAALGFRDDDLAIIEEELKRPDGMILNTGPTGSGKTTTLYAFLRKKYRPEIKIVTIEHPIEYHLAGIEQTQVDEKTGYDFATALQSMLRQDPDVILVGEINNRETAEVGMQAALTGHLVFSTVHANSAPAAIPRLVDLGVSSATIGPAVNLIIAQRLVRKLCHECRERITLDAVTTTRIQKFLATLPARVTRPQLEEIVLYTAKGCTACSGFGFRGRIGIFELFLVDDAIESAMQLDSSLANLLKLAETQGMVSVQRDGILKVLGGLTTFEEIESVTGPLQW